MNTSHVGKLVMILFLVLFFAVVDPAPLQLVGLMLFGWVRYLASVLPNVEMNQGAAISAGACLVGVLVLGQMLGNFFWTAMKPETSGASKWRFRWTLLATAGIIVMFASGIAAVGVTHQSAWLARSEEPWFTSNQRWPIVCRSNMNALRYALAAYAQDNDGRLPDRLDDLVEAKLIRENFACPAVDAYHRDSSNSSASYVYHGRGLRLPLPSRVILVCEPCLNHQGKGMNVLYSNGETEFLSPTEAERAMRLSIGLLQSK